jgi:hypothetical protein
LLSWKISDGIGSAAEWCKDNKELYYVSQNQVIAVALDRVSTGLPFGAPRILFTVPRNTSIDIAQDGQRFLARRS